jgi:uncharacterized protein YyaL (SSP411 family)
MMAAGLAAASQPAPAQEVTVPNRLARETSPYLLQHAHNPVDWRPWGEEAFDEARRRGVPIFLSIGYSTCYWCHVMERESFEDPGTAALMNELFVCVKVDREERPEVDDLYMAATQIMTGSGGWPMSVFVEPGSLRPFWCGTYFPPDPAHGRPSFRQVLRGMSTVWAERRDEVMRQARELGDAVADHLGSGTPPARLGSEQVAGAVSALIRLFDRTEGGFGGAPKFPQPVYLEFLLDARGSVDGETRAAINHALRFTLDRMAAGGLFDQAGGGFHRYCVDATWTVPHFEKMLYDNAQLAAVYARAAALFDDAFYRRVTRRTLDFVLREMTGDHGGFFSAQDAEVDHREGLNYLWTPDQIRGALPPAEAGFAISAYGLDRGTNFLDPHHPEDGPKNVLRLEGRPETVATRMGLTETEFLQRLDRVNAALLGARAEREQPALDDKVLASWNGMMIAAMVQGGRVLGEARYLDAGERAAGFLLSAMRGTDGGLFRSRRDGRSLHAGGLEDHAWAIVGLLALHGAGRGDGRYLRASRELAELVHRSFLTEDGAYADVAEGREDLFVRARSTYDGATPSGAGVMVHALLGLHAEDPDGPWLDRALARLGALSGTVARQAVGSVNSTRAVLRVLHLDDAAPTWLEFGEEPATPPGSSAGVVEVYADAERVVVRETEPAEILLGFRIKAGYHILAAEAVAEGASITGLVPLRVGLISGGGVAVYAEYPEGEAYGAAFVGRDELRVHTGELRLRVAIEKAEGVGAGPGSPVLGVIFQACDDAACLGPATVRLGVEIVVE